MIVHIVLHNTAQNSSDNLSSYPPDEAVSIPHGNIHVLSTCILPYTVYVHICVQDFTVCCGQFIFFVATCTNLLALLSH